MTLDKTTTKSSSPSQAGRPRVKLFSIAAVLIAVLAAGGYALLSSGGEPAETAATFKVAQGPLVISVNEAGTIANKDVAMVKSEVEGRTSILWLVAEGADVEKGELLVELDSSSLVDQKDQKEITVQNADAAFVRARENFAVAESQAQSDIEKAELAVKFAEMDRTKYIEGEYPQQLEQAQADITIAAEELERATETYESSRKLADQGYITETELAADRLSKNRRELELKLARRDLELLKTYTSPRTLEQLDSDVKQATAELERTRRKARADVIQAEADLKAKQSEFGRQKDQLAKIVDQIAKCRITAPVSGMAVYATTGEGNWRGNAEPLQEGQEIREGQELIKLPTTSSMIAEVKIHEASLRKVSTGMPARVTVDALPGEVFAGELTRIALLPDAQSIWLNPDLKVYESRVDIRGNGGELKPGMSCRVEVIAARYEDALYVPVQAVVQVQGRHAVYLPDGRSPRRQWVQIGENNGRMVHILDGLEAGQEVLLSPPLSEAVAPALGDTPDMEPDDADDAAESESADEPASRPAGENAAVDLSKLREMTPEQRREFLENLTPEQRRTLTKRAGRGRDAPREDAAQ